MRNDAPFFFRRCMETAVAANREQRVMKDYGSDNGTKVKQRAGDPRMTRPSRFVALSFAVEARRNRCESPCTGEGHESHVLSREAAGRDGARMLGPA